MEGFPMRHLRVVGSIMCVAALLMATSCGPETQGPHTASTESPEPLNARVPDAVATAVDWWITREPTAMSKGPVAISLAPSLASARDRIADLLPTCDVTDTDSSDALAVRAVRMHFTSAQVDLDAPHDGRGRQLITVDLSKYLLTPWQVSGANWWRFNDRQLERITKDAVASTRTATDEAGSSDKAPETADATDEH